MGRLPVTALVEAGFLRKRCEEVAFLKCRECGLNFGAGDACQHCYCTAAPLQSCQRCQLTVNLAQAVGERVCQSVDAYEQGQERPAFAPPGGLWACKTGPAGNVTVLAEAELRARLTDGRLDGAVLLQGPTDQAFSPASARSEFPELQARALAAREQAARAEEAERQRLAEELAEQAREEKRRQAQEQRLRLKQEAEETRKREEAEQAEQARVNSSRLTQERREQQARELAAQAQALAEAERQAADTLLVEEAALAAARERLRIEQALQNIERSKSRASWKRWGSALALAGVATMAWNLPVVQERWLHRSGPDAAGQLAAPATVPAAAPATAAAPTLPALPVETHVLADQPAPPVVTPTATPVFGGYVTDNAKALPVDETAYLAARLELLGGVGIKARLVVIETTGPESLQEFGARVGNAWNAAGEDSRSDLLMSVASKDRTIRIDLTRDMTTRLSDAEAKVLIDAHFQPDAAKAGIAAGLRALVDQLDRLTAAKAAANASEEGLRKQTVEALSLINASVGIWDGRQNVPAQALRAALDSAMARLEAMPRPARGDRKLARKLNDDGIALLRQTDFETLALDKLRQAHAADPLDLETVNNLAYAEQRAGHHREAVQYLLKTLRLAPRRTDAWANLAESLPHIALNPQAERPVVVQTYTTAYWFSHDKAKTLEFLRTKAAATDVHEVVRAAADEALQKILKFDAVALDAGSMALARRP